MGCRGSRNAMRAAQRVRRKPTHAPHEANGAAKGARRAAALDCRGGPNPSQSPSPPCRLFFLLTHPHPQLDGLLASSVPWALVLAPEWVSHAARLSLFASIVARRGAIVAAQLGPPPGPAASPSLVVTYDSMRWARRRAAAVKGSRSALEVAAELATTLLLCRALESGAVAAGAACWRLIFAPMW